MLTRLAGQPLGLNYIRQEKPALNTGFSGLIRLLACWFHSVQYDAHVVRREMLKPESTHSHQLVRIVLESGVHLLQKLRCVLALHNKCVHRESFNVSEDRTTYQNESFFFRFTLELRQSLHSVVGIKRAGADDLLIFRNRLDWLAQLLKYLNFLSSKTNLCVVPSVCMI